MLLFEALVQMNYRILSHLERANLPNRKSISLNFWAFSFIWNPGFLKHWRSTLWHSLMTSCLQIDIRPFWLDFHMTFPHSDQVSQSLYNYLWFSYPLPNISLSNPCTNIPSFPMDSSTPLLPHFFRPLSSSLRLTHQAFLRGTFGFWAAAEGALAWVTFLSA